MKTYLAIVVLVSVFSAGATAQLVVFDNSHASGHPMYDTFIDSLNSWGYTVEKRSGSLENNNDADILVILPEDAYNSGIEPYTNSEAIWIKDFVDSGKGLYASICSNSDYWETITTLMDQFGIARGSGRLEPVYYNIFAPHPIFKNVTELGDDYTHCTTLDVIPPCTAVGGMPNEDIIAVYETSARGDGAAIWTSHYYMLDAEGLDDYDNLQYLKNAFAWLTQGGGVSREKTSWGLVKALYR